MDINELINEATALVGDNKELSSILGKIKSTSDAIVTKKDELVEKVSTLSGGIKELGSNFGIEKESAKEILAEISGKKGEFESKISTLSTDKDGFLTKLADLEQKFNDKAKGYDALMGDIENEKRSNQLLKRTDELRGVLAESGIKDKGYQDLAIAKLKEDNGDLLSIDNIAESVKTFADNNQRLVDTSLRSGNGSKIDTSLADKEIKWGMSVEEEAKILEQKIAQNKG